MAQYTESHIATLLQNPGIIRNRQKVHAAITNARRFLDVRAAFGSFAAYIWRSVDHTPMVHTLRTLQEYPATSPESDALSKDLRQRGLLRSIGSRWSGWRIKRRTCGRLRIVRSAPPTSRSIDSSALQAGQCGRAR